MVLRSVDKADDGYSRVDGGDVSLPKEDRTHSVVESPFQGSHFIALQQYGPGAQVGRRECFSSSFGSSRSRSRPY